MKRVFNIIVLFTLAAIMIGAYLLVSGRLRVDVAARQIEHGRRVEFSGPPPSFCKCHSKNPAMRRMHLAFGLSDCTLCHGDANLMNRGGRRKPDAAGLRHRMATTPICLQCHRAP